jgi:small conductance mechanosensitive channel
LLSDTERRRRGQRVETLTAVLANVVSLAIWAIAALVIIGELGIDLAPLLAGAGVITVVIGFGAQTVVRDYLAGLFMVLEDQYGVGDEISIDADTTGRVEGISLRVTRLRDDDGIVWWVPNGEIKKLGNLSHRPPGPEDGDDAEAQ